MDIHIRDLEATDKILVKGERVEGSATQRRLGPGGSLTSPTTIVVTDKRIIVIKRAIFGLRHDYEVMSLTIITSIKLKHGFISSSIFIRTQGSESDSGSQRGGKQEGEIFGLTKNDAERIANLINGNIAKREALDRSHQVHKTHEEAGANHFCSKCGAKVLKSSAFCRNCGNKF